MEHKPLEATTSDTFAGQKFNQTTTEAGEVSYFINGVAVEKAFWNQQVEAAEDREMINTAGEEPPERVG